MPAIRPLDEDAFIAALMGEDELGAVIRGHIYVEATLLTLLAGFVVSEKHLNQMGLDYFQHVNLAIALGLKVEYGPPLHALGTLRNAFSHKLNASLSRDRVNGLYKTLSSEDRTMVQTIYEKTNRKMRQEPGTRFRNLPPKDQFILIAVALRFMLVAAAHELSEAGGAA